MIVSRTGRGLQFKSQSVPLPTLRLRRLPCPTFDTERNVYV